LMATSRPEPPVAGTIHFAHPAPQPSGERIS
jgi:hypothetical protein